MHQIKAVTSCSTHKIATILETINHVLQCGSKVFSCFLDVRKVFDTVWIDGILYKLFSELSIEGRMWKVMKDLYTNVKAQDLYAGSLSRKNNFSHGKVEFLRDLCIKYTSMGFYVC